MLVQRPLTEADAVDIWIARWLRIRRKDLLIRYGCDPRRLYEIWEEKRFAGSRAKALALFQERYPGLTDRVDFGRHRRIHRAVPPELQPGLFDQPDPGRRLSDNKSKREQIRNICLDVVIEFAACSLYVLAGKWLVSGGDGPSQLAAQRAPPCAPT